MSVFQRTDNISNLDGNSTTAHSINNVIWVNDATQLSNAIADNTHIRIPSGVTITDPQITMTGIDNCIIEGSGESSVVTGTTSGAFILNNCTFLTFKNFKYTGTSQSLLSDVTAGSTDITASGIVFDGITAIPLGFNNETGHARHTIEKCHFTGCSGTQEILYDAGLTDGIIRNCTIAASTSGDSICISVGVRCQITGCNIVKTGGDNAIVLDGASSANNTISGDLISCTGISSGGNGIKVDNQDGCNITNNVVSVDGTLTNGIRVASVSNHIVISGNLTKDCTDNGIFIEGDNCLLVANKCESNDVGLSIGSSANNTVEIGNDLSGNTTSDFTDSGTATHTAGAVGKNNLTATTNPGVTNDIDEGYLVGSRWINVTADDEFVCLDNTDGAAVWTITTTGAVTMQEEGSPIGGAPHSTLNFVGSSITVSDAGSNVATLTSTGLFIDSAAGGDTMLVGGGTSGPSAVSPNDTLLVDRNFTPSSATAGSQITIRGDMTGTGTAAAMAGLFIDGTPQTTFTTIASATHPIVAAARIGQIAVTAGDADSAVTDLASLYIANAPTDSGFTNNPPTPYSLLIADGNSIFKSSTGSTSTTSGALVVTGGVGIGENLYVGGTANFTGDTTFSGELFLSDGLDSAPSYSFSNSTGTGMWSSATDTLNFSTAGVERMEIASNGNFGLGIASSSGIGIYLNHPVSLSTTGLVWGTSLAGALTNTSTSASTQMVGVSIGASSITNFTVAGDVTDMARIKVNTFEGTSSVTSKTITNLAGALINKPIVNADGGFTPAVTNMATLMIDDAPSGVTPTNGPYAIYVQSGTSRFDGEILAADGAVGTPAYSFSSDTNTGMYSFGPEEIGFATDGVNRVVIGGAAASEPVLLTTTSTSDNTITTRIQNTNSTALEAYSIFQLERQESANGSGVGLEFRMGDSSGDTAFHGAGFIGSIIKDNSSTSYDAALTFRIPIASTDVDTLIREERMRLSNIGLRVGSAGEATDTLDVDGTANISGDVTFGGGLSISGTNTAEQSVTVTANDTPNTNASTACVRYTVNTGTGILTTELADGNYVGQMITLRLDTITGPATGVQVDPATGTAASGGNGNFTSLIMDAENDYFTLVWTGTGSTDGGWKGVGGNLSGGSSAFNA